MKSTANKMVVKNIVRRNIQFEKRRNIMIIIAIALASFLICFSGLIVTSLMEVQKKQIQDTYEAVYMNVSEEKFLNLKEEVGFERVGQYYIVGDMPSSEKYTATYFYMNQPMLYMMRNQMGLSSGEVPKEENQIAVCRNWLEKYEKNKKIGDKITLSTEKLSGEYTISGILDMESSGETFPFLISWEKLKNYKEYDENSNMIYVHVKEKNATDIKEYCSKNLAKIKNRDTGKDTSKSTLQVKGTKTSSSNRIIPLNSKAINALRELQMIYRQCGIKSKYVACSQKGGFLTNNRMHNLLERDRQAAHDPSATSHFCKPCVKCWRKHQRSKQMDGACQYFHHI